MMSKKVIVALLGLLSVGLLAPVIAQDKKPEGAKPAGGQEGQPAPSPEEQAMMEAWAKLASPGPHHEHLKPLAGNWNVEGKWRMAEEAPWTPSNSKAKTEWILGGRFLHQHYKGDPMMPGDPTPFEGYGIVGYDNQKQKYVSAWVDNMGTMIMMSEGTCDSSGKTVTFTAKFMDPMMNKETWMKMEYKIEGEDKYTLSMFAPDMTGKEYLMMVLTHTRQK
ncbi:MAG: DUF1579 family protein [Phycisphaerae bacterium]|nr:DUF1579 domain-containing protein [Phycisphaerae bacterium]MCL4717893.1 DUF1579 family protein [Phycisphaerae bacterium]NUQ07480.1 DUF1579 domain-containing protein [Phycisphaerae bacterium]